MSTSSHKPSDPALAFLVGAQAFAIVFLFVWFVFAVGLWIGVRAVGGVLAHIGGVVIWLYPVAVVAASVVSWRAYRAGDRRRARIAALIPFLWVVPILVIIVIRGL